MERSNIDTAKQVLLELLAKMGFAAEVFERSKENQTVLNIKTADAQLLIGKQGANLEALQYVVYLLLKRKDLDGFAFALDVDDYKEKREIYIKEIARKAAHQARTSRRSVGLPPMNGYERKVVHNYLSLFSDLTSESVGEGLDRRVIIKNSKPPKSDELFEFIENS
ncbi:MAG: KH domain-containing protein [Candidatus Doudnabacteria bacterium]|nr:KH domain-containing protein [Candidatus Doudnabacteria bacterium]